jgi:hypothetical protein
VKNDIGQTKKNDHSIGNTLYGFTDKKKEEGLTYL